MTWDKYYPYFKKEEFDCKHTGKNRMRPEFMDILLEIRKTYDLPMQITSGYRDVTHPIEIAKANPGEHTYGVACDIAIQGANVADLIVIAYGYGIRRFGVQQKGGSRFLHLGMGDKYLHFPQTTWSY